MTNNQILEAMAMADNIKAPDFAIDISNQAHVNACDTVGGPIFGEAYSSEYLRIWKETVQTVLIDRGDEASTEFFSNIGIEI